MVKEHASYGWRTRSRVKKYFATGENPPMRKKSIHDFLRRNYGAVKIKIFSDGHVFITTKEKDFFQPVENIETLTEMMKE